MIQLSEHGVYLLHGETVVDETDHQQLTGRLGSVPSKDEAKKGTMAYSILKTHNTVDDMEQLSLKFDSMTSHDITYVGIIQTARASGMKEFPLPYVLTNCHNSLCAVASILEGQSCGNGTFKMSVYPGSMPAYLELVKNGSIAKLVESGVIIRECFCGPCFGAGDTPANGEFSIRHTTRNFPNREGSKPGEGQMAGVALMDARSIAATARNGGRLTAATELDVDYSTPAYHFDGGVYEKRVYNGWGKPEPEAELKFGPNIKDWPEMPALSDDILLKVVSHITDPVTTTDELIPSGETSSYRSNPLRLAEFTLSRKDPEYVGRAKAILALEKKREAGEVTGDEVASVYEALKTSGLNVDPANTVIASTIYANKPGDGSAREQAASCQRVLGAGANLALEYATKRYRSNCINWGMLPFLVKSADVVENGDWVFVPGIRKVLLEGGEEATAYAVHDGTVTSFPVSLGHLTAPERQILADGCLINYYQHSARK